MVDDLSPARVQVIFTARDLARTVPAAWQEFMQNREEWTWPEFLESVISDDASPTRQGRGSGHTGPRRAARELDENLPLEDVHVVTCRTRVRARTCCGSACARCWAASYAHDRRAAGSNSSLGMESAEMMRRLNRLAREDGFPPRSTSSTSSTGSRRGCSPSGTARSPGACCRPPHEWARREAARQIEAVRASA